MWWTAQRNVSRKYSEGLEWGVRAKEIEDIAWPRGGTKFPFSC